MDKFDEEAQREVDAIAPNVTGEMPAAAPAAPPVELPVELPVAPPAAATPAPEAPTADEPKRLLDITREEVKAAKDTAIEIVPVDEWKPGAVVYIHTPSIGDKDHLENVIVSAKNPDGSARKIGEDGVRAAFVAMCTRNSKGERIFTADDVEWLKTKSIAPMDRIFKAMMNVGVVISQKDVETIAKNSGAASNGIS